MNTTERRFLLPAGRACVSCHDNRLVAHPEETGLVKPVGECMTFVLRIEVQRTTWRRNRP